MDAKPHTGPVTLVTGGARGIGRAVVGHLVARYHAVSFIDVDARAANDLVAELSARRLPGRATYLAGDVSREADIERAIREIAAGHGRLDGLVNNAGIADPSAGPVESLSIEEWNRVIGVNLTGYFLTAKHATPLLRRSRGAIVNVASTRALQSEPNTEAYAASKGGIVALTHALAVSLGPEIRVNCVSPGWIDVRRAQESAGDDPEPLRPIDHEQHPVGRVGQPADIAALVSFLLSEQAGFITGQNIVVDGGMTRRMLYAD